MRFCAYRNVGSHGAVAHIRRGEAGKYIKHLLIAKGKAAVIDHQQSPCRARQQAAAEPRQIAITLPDFSHESETLEHAKQNETDEEEKTPTSIVRARPALAIHRV